MDEATQKLDTRLELLTKQFHPVYTQICLFFPITRSSQHWQRQHIIDTIQHGLQNLSKILPRIAGQVVRDGSFGTVNIRPLHSLPRLLVNQVSVLTYQDLKIADFPACLLGENALMPIPTRPAADTQVWPVLVIQLTFLEGGVVVGLEGQHSAVDMTGLVEVVRLLDHACKMDNGAGVRVDEVGSAGFESTGGRVESSDLRGGLEEKRYVWAFFHFSKRALLELKELALQDVPDGSFVSTDDALSACVWQSIIRVRQGNMEANAQTTISRTADLRQYLGVDPRYVGNLATKTYCARESRQLIQETVGVVALALRRLVGPATSRLREEAMARADVLSGDIRPHESTSQQRSAVDVNLSSWAKYTELWDFDFGLGLGKPEGVRRPRFGGSQREEGIVYLLPKAPNGSICVMICLATGDMDCLRQDREWMRWATYVE